MSRCTEAAINGNVITILPSSGIPSSGYLILNLVQEINPILSLHLMVKPAHHTKRREWTAYLFRYSETFLCGHREGHRVWSRGLYLALLARSSDTTILDRCVHRRFMMYGIVLELRF